MGKFLMILATAGTIFATAYTEPSLPGYDVFTLGGQNAVREDGLNLVPHQPLPLSQNQGAMMKPGNNMMAGNNMMPGNNMAGNNMMPGNNMAGNNMMPNNNMPGVLHSRPMGKSMPGVLGAPSNVMSGNPFMSMPFFNGAGNGFPVVGFPSNNVFPGANPAVECDEFGRPIGQSPNSAMPSNQVPAAVNGTTADMTTAPHLNTTNVNNASRPTPNGKNNATMPVNSSIGTFMPSNGSNSTSHKPKSSISVHDKTKPVNGTKNGSRPKKINVSVHIHVKKPVNGTKAPHVSKKGTNGTNAPNSSKKPANVTMAPASSKMPVNSTKVPSNSTKVPSSSKKPVNVTKAPKPTSKLTSMPTTKPIDTKAPASTTAAAKGKKHNPLAIKAHITISVKNNATNSTGVEIE